jgi:hypothetical protein
MDCPGTDRDGRHFHSSAVDGGGSSSSDAYTHHQHLYHHHRHDHDESYEDNMLAAACHETLDEEELETFATSTTIPNPRSSSSSYGVGGGASNHQPSRTAFYLKTGLAPPPDATLHNMKNYGRRHFLKMREAELHIYAPDPTYEHRQTELRPDMRAQLLDWLMEVGANFFVHRRTFQAAVNYCDRFLSTVAFVFPKDRLQLLAITSLFVASKMEEVYPPKAQELAEATAGAFTARDVVTFETELMTTLAWNLTPPTSDDWAEWYLLAFLERGLPVAAAALEGQQQEQQQQQQHLLLLQRLPSGVAQRVQLLLDLALLDVTSLHFYPSMLAAAGLYLLLPPAFHPALAIATGYPPADRALEHCKAYLTFLSAGLFDALLPVHDQQPQQRQHHQHQAFLTALVSPRTQAAQALVPMWDRHSFQNHPANLLPHLLGRITAISGHGDDTNLRSSSSSSSNNNNSISSSSMFVAAAAAATAVAAAAVVAPFPSPPLLLPPPPSFLGYRSVSSGNLLVKEKEEEEQEEEEEGSEEGMDLSGDEDEEGTEGKEEEDEEEEEANEEDFFGHSLELHDDWGYTNKKKISKRGEEEEGGREGGDYSCDQALRLEELGGEGSENELGWSTATTTDPQTTRDSVFSFFSSEEKEKGEEGVEVEGWMGRGERRREGGGEGGEEEDEDEDNDDMRAESWKGGASSPCLASFFFPDDVTPSSSSATTMMARTRPMTR